MAPRSHLFVVLLVPLILIFFVPSLTTGTLRACPSFYFHFF